METETIFTIMIIIMAIVMVVTIVVGATNYKTNKCFDECYENEDRLKEANFTGYGIDHTCYDYCIGGAVR